MLAENVATVLVDLEVASGNDQTFYPFPYSQHGADAYAVSAGHRFDLLGLQLRAKL